MLSTSIRQRLAIGICTRQRHALLRRLLESIWEQPAPEHYDVEIIVVDNNDAPLVAPEDFDHPAKFKLTVLHEAKPGLVNARNRVLDAAIAMNADWLIGVDDDEWVSADWLDQFIIGIETLDTSIIVAAKQIVYPKTTNRFIKRLRQEQLPAGADTTIFSTANFAMHKRVFAPDHGPALRFHFAFNESGGEDFEFMLRAKHQYGFRAAKWPYAIVTEEFDGKRETFRYHVKRQLLNQVTRYHVLALHRTMGVRGSHLGNAKKIFLITNKFAIFGTAECMRGAALLIMGQPTAYEIVGSGLFKWARALAVFPYLFGKTVVAYGSTVNADRSDLR
ncbi:GT2 family glycosyltransferase [Yoonia maricola]|uniref:GT2 family glycosyltransferase n=1 Tax=Yoonia maricola TaxID=420999 RepID=A0A2M8WL03_9RHOB|nr:glycosyltransferase [Yoonia maricola]PJI91614.1 GT2 family glycosyltransferase [Yoonia maricola]